MMESLKRLRQSTLFWTVLGVFVAIFGAVAVIPLAGTIFEHYAAQIRLLGLGGISMCFITGLLVLALELLRRFSGYLGSGIRTLVIFARGNLLVVVPLVTAIFLVWRLFYFAESPAVFSMVSLLVVACIAMTVGLIRLLAMTRPSFLGLAAARTDLWRYDFIDHFDDPTTHKLSEHPRYIRVTQRAIAHATLKPAVFQHPPSHGQAVLTYQVEQVPEHVKEVELEFFTGILDEIRDERTGQVEPVTQFASVPGNRIRFEIWVDEDLVFGEERNAVGWSELKRISKPVPSGTRLIVSFRTDAMGNNRWNWAAWGEPRLVEVSPTSSAAG